MEMNRKEFGLAGKDEAAIAVVSRIERIVDQEFAFAGLQRFHPDLRPFPVRRDRRITKDGEKDGTPVGEKVRKSVGYLVSGGIKGRKFLGIPTRLPDHAQACSQVVRKNDGSVLSPADSRRTPIRSGAV